MKKMKKQLIELLKIQAPSGQEHKVVNYLKPQLKKLTDACWVDHYGNLLAEKKVGSGEGATIILSAHMDSVNRLEKGRQILEDDGVFASSKGVLGADDRAGIAIIMSVLRNVEKTGFEGTIKVAFSREEEIGCIGSGKIDKNWYKGSDLAIVVDRRGNRDIVTGCYSPFCSNEVGYFLEDCSALLNMDWKATEGGISDATTFSDNGVNSVNLSAGYYNEHTDKEYVVFDYMVDTTNLILQALALVNQFAPTFGQVPTSNDWVFGYSYGSYSGYGGYNWYDEDEVLLPSTKDTFGKVDAEIIDGNVCITQKSGKNSDEIFITAETFRKIADAFYSYEMTNDLNGTQSDHGHDLSDISAEELEFLSKHGM